MLKLIDNKNVEPWYLGFAFQGAVVLGSAPILIPLIVSKFTGAAYVGIIVAAFYLGQILAPVFGSLADKTKKHIFFYLGGYILLAAGLCLFGITEAIPILFLLAFLQGAGAAATNTVAGMYIVEFKPKSEWDNRIGWLQTFYGTGQCLGLVLAAVIQKTPVLGMIISGALMLPGMILGVIKLPKVRLNDNPDVSEIHHSSHRPLKNFLSVLHHYHKPDLKVIKNLLTHLKSYFTLFLVSWFILMFGFWMIFNLYPLIMKEVYSINPGLSSAYYAFGAGIGIVFYFLSGKWGEKYGELKVYLLGLIMSIVALIVMGIFAYYQTSFNYVIVPAFFLLMPVAWSPLIVSGTGLTALLTDMNQGSALGLFNAGTALASVLSALAAGFIAANINYNILPPIACITLIVSLLIALPIFKSEKIKRKKLA